MSEGYAGGVDKENEESSLDVEICNRRLSRAARSLLEGTLRRTVLLGDPLINDNDDIWTLLEHWLRNARSAECPLFPSRDMLRHDEEQSIALKPPSLLKGAYPALTLKERRKASPKRPRQWWKCGICSKIFASRYYMDLHLQTLHNGDENTDSMLICPAEEWCQLLGEANCHEQAFLNEPFYGRGSDGWRDDGKFIQHRFAKQAHSVPCNVETLRSNCRATLDACRVSDQGLCDTLACPAHHQYFRQDASSSQILDDWRSVWMYETKHHHTGTIVGIFLCVLLCAWVYYMTMIGPFHGDSLRKHLKPSKKFPQKSSSTNNPSTADVRRFEPRMRKSE